MVYQKRGGFPFYDMNINIKTTNIILNQAFREFIEKKIAPLEKFTRIIHNENYRSPSGKVKSVLEAFVEIEKGTHHKKGPFFRAECQLKLPRKIIRSEAQSTNLRIAINQVKDELQRKLKKLKRRSIAKIKRKSRVSKKELKISPSARFYKKTRAREEGE
jgi:ribosomal subunit interface protein